MADERLGPLTDAQRASAEVVAFTPVGPQRRPPDRNRVGVPPWGSAPAGEPEGVATDEGWGDLPAEPPHEPDPRPRCRDCGEHFTPAVMGRKRLFCSHQCRIRNFRASQK
jgi:hypothetical protein